MKRKSKFIIGFVSLVLTYGTLLATVGVPHHWKRHFGRGYDYERQHHCSENGCEKSISNDSNSTKK